MGQPDEASRKMYAAVLKAQLAGIEAVAVGVNPKKWIAQPVKFSRNRVWGATLPTLQGMEWDLRYTSRQD